MDPAVEIELAALSYQKPMNDVIDRGDSAVQKFYSGATVFVTGGTGFLGKQFIEKLFRSCNLKTMYLLMRAKKGKTIEERLQAMLADPVFDLVREKHPLFAVRIVPIEGDAINSKLGLSDKNWATISKEVNIIFHMAATVRFDEPLKVATYINIRGTKEVISLARSCQNLKQFIHVSTAFSHATKDRVGKEVSEQFYTCPVPPDVMIQLAETMDEDRLNDITPDLIKGWPNTYTFTKAIAEELIRTTAADLPVCVVKPPIVLPCYYEPSPGWLDLNGLAGPSAVLMNSQALVATFQSFISNGEERARNSMVTVFNSEFYIVTILIYTLISNSNRIFFGVILGVLHVFFVKPETRLALVPLDYTNNAIIGAGWDSSERKKDGDKDIPIYILASEDSLVPWNLFSTQMRTHCKKIVTLMAVWYCYLLETNSKIIYTLLTWFLHYILAYVLDAICNITGKRPNNIPSFVKVYEKIDKKSALYRFFLTNDWLFRGDNFKCMFKRMSDADKVIFNCDITQIDFIEYTIIWVVGVRKYILKDGLKGSAEAVKKQRLFFIANIIFMCLYSYILWSLANTIFSVLKFVIFSVL